MAPVFVQVKRLAFNAQSFPLLRPPIFYLKPRRFRRNTHVFLLGRVERRIKRTDRNRNPIRKRTIRIRPEQRSPTIRTKLPRDPGRRLKTLERVHTARDGNVRPGNAGIRRKRGAMGLSAFAAMTVRHGFQLTRNLIAHRATETAALMKFIHVHRLLEKRRGDARPVMLRHHGHKKTGANQAPVFHYSLTCARKRRPITSIKSQPSRNGMTNSLEKSANTTVSQPISAR